MFQRTFHVDECVVYCVTKYSCKPSLRARDVAPAPRGDTYTYRIDKYWVVDEVLPDGALVLRTRRGKTHIVSMNDPHLRRPNMLEKLLIRHRFPDPRSHCTAARTA